MAGPTQPSMWRRRVLQVAGLAPLAVAAPAALPAAPETSATHYLATVASRLNLLRPDLLRLGARLREAVPAAALESITTQVACSIGDAVGPVLVSAEATVPGLIADDFEQGRVLAIDGVVFRHTEIALLGAIDRERARAARG